MAGSKIGWNGGQAGELCHQDRGEALIPVMPSELDRDFTAKMQKSLRSHPVGCEHCLEFRPLEIMIVPRLLPPSDGTSDPLRTFTDSCFAICNPCSLRLQRQAPRTHLLRVSTRKIQALYGTWEQQKRARCDTKGTEVETHTEEDAGFMD